MKINKWFIIIVSILIVSVIICLILINIDKKENNTNNENKDVDKENTIKQEEIDQQENEKYQNIPPSFSNNVGYQEYFTVNNCIEKKLNGNSEKQNIIYTPIEIKKLNQGDVVSYAAYGVIANAEMESAKDVYYLVDLDTINYTYSVKKVEGTYSNITQIQASNVKNIEKDNSNSFEYQELSDQYKYKQIFKNMKNLMLTKPEIAYKYLDEEYKKERFENYENFVEYVNNNRKHLLKVEPKSFKDNNGESSILRIRDQYSEWYEFKINDVMSYTAKIDNYVLLSDEDIKDYNSYTDNQKIKYNINRWIRMINCKDYKFAYKYLSEGFKKKNYSTLEEFTKFMESKYPKYYEISSTQLSKKGNIYTAKIELKVEGEEFDDKYITIMMRLDEGTDFTMSFSAQ